MPGVEQPDPLRMTFAVWPIEFPVVPREVQLLRRGITIAFGDKLKCSGPPKHVEIVLTRQDGFQVCQY